MTQKVAIIIGAGPAGLTAALDFLRKSAIRPIVLEASDEIGGISRTVRYKGNRMDIGGHRFFSKSDRVMDWWMELMPPVQSETGSTTISYQNRQRTLDGIDKASHLDPDLVMLVRPRRSRIYFLRSFFAYPITLTADTLRKLGVVRTVKVGMSYLLAKLKPRKPEISLEDFLINRFGFELYQTFFKSYTEKVWGVRCDAISAEWGAQRIKGLSLTSAIAHFLKKAFSLRKRGSIAQKDTETSLIEQFLYPKYGPGQLWEHVAELIRAKGGEVLTGWRVNRIETDGADCVMAVEAVSSAGEQRRFPGDYFLSTMPVKELIVALDRSAPANVVEVSQGLMYRDFVTVGLLVDKLSVTEPDGSPLKDTWIYIQEPDVLLGRLQIFKQLESVPSGGPEQGMAGARIFLL